jgi:hypothetical protein
MRSNFGILFVFVSNGVSRFCRVGAMLEGYSEEFIMQLVSHIEP